MSDWGSLYRANVAALGAMARDLTDEQLATQVAATPEWTVRDVLGHLAGGPADTISGRMDGAPSPEWTARHVAERRPLTVEDVVAEMESNQEAVAAAAADSPRPAIVWDVAVHHADLHETLGLGQMPEELWAPVSDAVAPKMAPELVGTVPPYEVFRAVFSRRSRDQIRSWGIDVDDERLEKMCVFGPRDDDQPVPA